MTESEKNMRICVFDTETTNLEKPFVYNIGFLIADTESGEVLTCADYVVEQVWHNLELFQTAYYAEKRPLYVSRMRGKTARLEKFGHITQIMARLFKEFEVEYAFAYNSGFDVKVFEYNCDWFKCINPFDNVKVLDIRGYVHNKIAFTPRFQQFCDRNELYTERGNYSTTAETLYRFIYDDMSFDEEHTALADSVIEYQILLECVKRGCVIGEEYKTYRSVPRKVEKSVMVKVANEILFIDNCNKYQIKETANEIQIILK